MRTSCVRRTGRPGASVALMLAALKPYRLNEIYPMGVGVGDGLRCSEARERGNERGRDHPRVDPRVVSPGEREAVMHTKTYTVNGMTCGHCVNAVSTEVGRIPGVSDVQVDLASGSVTLTSQQPVDHAAVRAAVDEAGYQLVG